MTPSQWKKRVLKLASRPAEHFLEIGDALAILKALMGGEQFRAMLKSAGIGSRKAYYLINIAEQLRPYRRYRARLQKLGWTKCQIIAELLPGANFHDLLSFAEEHTAKQLGNYDRDHQAKSPNRCVLLYFTPQQYRQYEEAVVKFGAVRRGRGLVNKEAATVKMAKTAMQSK